MSRRAPHRHPQTESSPAVDAEPTPFAKVVEALPEADEPVAEPEGEAQAIGQELVAATLSANRAGEYVKGAALHTLALRVQDAITALPDAIRHADGPLKAALEHLASLL